MQKWLHRFVTVAVSLYITATAIHAQQPTRTIEVHAKKYSFSPDSITLKKGETVQLVLISDDVPHTLAVENLPIHTEMVKDQPKTITLTPAETGDFPGRCSKFCGSGHRDMHFVIHVVN